MNRLGIWLAMLILARFSVSFAADVGSNVSLVPKPLELVAQNGQMLLGNPVSISYQPDSEGIKRSGGVEVLFGTSVGPKDLLHKREKISRLIHD